MGVVLVFIFIIGVIDLCVVINIIVLKAVTVFIVTVLNNIVVIIVAINVVTKGCDSI